jgi:hypothetical protein
MANNGLRAAAGRVAKKSAKKGLGTLSGAACPFPFKFLPSRTFAI